jgi:hypothetical protein
MTMGSWANLGSRFILSSIWVPVMPGIRTSSL